MFERYTEKARRAVFYSRYEASQVGSRYIETEYLLLGLLREDKALTNRYLRTLASVESIRKQIEARTTIREKVSTSVVDLPLSNESKRVLAYAAEEAERLSHKHIGTEHLLLGLLREEKCFAAEILHERGLRLSAIREDLAREGHETAQRPPLTIPDVLRPLSRDLTQAAADSELDPIVGRAQEIDWVIEILCSRNNRNPMLIGERGAGKTAVIEGWAQRIADRDVPPFLVDKTLLVLDVRLVADSAKDAPKSEEGLNAIIKALTDTPNIIILLDEFQSLFGRADAGEFFRPAILSSRMQCIGACTPRDYQKLIEAAPWLGRCFRTVAVAALDEENTVKALYARKGEYEKFHAVSYTDEAIQYAVFYTAQCFSNDPILTKATEILDAAGTRVNLRQVSLPEEVIEVQKRIKFIVHRMENAIVNREFEKARFYSEEERKERENLRGLREKYRLEDSAAGVVCREDIESVISRWTGMSIESIKKAASDVLSERSKPADAAELPLPQPEPATAAERPLLRAFLCHSSKDKPAVRELNQRLKASQFDTWLDEERILPGQDWELEISKAVRACQVVIVCLSGNSTNKSGYVQREMRAVLDVADEQPEGTIYLIPVKLEECDVPARFRRVQWVSLFETNGFERLMQSLRERARSLPED